jgi:hypothetical protein
MIRGAEDLPQEADETKEDQNPSDKRTRDWTNFARDREQWSDLLRQALTKSWL